MGTQTKLELTWIGKEEKLKPEPRILLEQPELNYGDKDTENMLIHGDNLLALKALEQKFTGKVKCIYIDPPYNTGAAFEHYNDNFEHSIWLSLMRPRLELLRNLLSDDGSIWISIDSDEGHYLKVLCDEVFGRKNFVDEVIWQRAFSPVNLKKTLSKSHDILLVYAKENTDKFTLNTLARKTEQTNTYKNPDNDPRGVWTSADCTVGPVVQEKLYEVITPSGRRILPPIGRCWLFTKDRLEEMVADNRIWFGEKGTNTPRVKKFLTEVKQGVVATTLWLRDEVGDNQEAKKEIKSLNFESVFATPKPERLIERILTLGSNENDLVLDSFLGSGTTCAVAHKMNRRWIGVELGEHAYTHCKVRLDKVIDGEQGGISKATNWKGGGGYKFYELAPTLVKKDMLGVEILNPEYNSEMLASAVAKHEGFEYNPDATVFWKQSKFDNSYLFVTTRHITLEYLQQIANEMIEGEFLVIAAKSFDSNIAKQFKNIKVKKIPNMLLNNCQFDVDNYNLNIVSASNCEEVEDDE